MCHHKAPHEWFQFADRHRLLFDDEHIPEPASLWEDKAHRSPGSRQYGATISRQNPRINYVDLLGRYGVGGFDVAELDDDDQTRAAYQKYLKDYLRCVAAVDESVGALLRYLADNGLEENTVVIYTSDQGMFLGEHDYMDKRWIFQESLRMPLLLRYPAEVNAGSVSGSVVTNVDFAPTLLDYAGCATPPYMQGRSFRRVVAGEVPRDWPTSMYYRYWMHMAHEEVPAHYGVVTERFKLVFFYGLGLDAQPGYEPTTPGWELYDLEADPEELHNVYEEPAYVDTVAGLKRELSRLKVQYDDGDEKYPALMALL